MSSIDQAALDTALAPIKQSIEGLETTLKNLPDSTKAEVHNNIRVRFQEAGNWGRHYSTVRMGVTTFLISLSIGILAFNWQYWAPRPRPTFIYISIVIWLLAAFLFAEFTARTYKAAKREVKHRRRLSVGDTDPHKEPVAFDSACLAMLLLTIAFGIFVSYLLFCIDTSTAEPGPIPKPTTSVISPTATPANP
jgi:hypothetical protein